MGPKGAAEHYWPYSADYLRTLLSNTQRDEHIHRRIHTQPNPVVGIELTIIKNVCYAHFQVLFKNFNFIVIKWIPTGIAYRPIQNKISRYLMGRQLDDRWRLERELACVLSSSPRRQQSIDPQHETLLPGKRDYARVLSTNDSVSKGSPYLLAVMVSEGSLVRFLIHQTNKITAQHSRLYCLPL